MYQLISENYQQLNDDVHYPLLLANQLGLDTAQLYIDFQDPELTEQLDWEQGQFEDLDRFILPTFMINGYRLPHRTIDDISNLIDCLSTCNN